MADRPAQQGDISYVVGKVEEGFKQLQAAHSELRTDIAERFARSAAVDESHQNSDNTIFKELRETNIAIMSRLQNLEGYADMVQSHADTLLNLEQRQATVEESERTRMKLKDNDRKWQRVVAVLVVILFVDKFTGSSLSALLPKLAEVFFK